MSKPPRSADPFAQVIGGSADHTSVFYGSSEISIKTVLAVLADFERLEPTGVSTDLVAWELAEPEHEIESVMHCARQRGMISRAGWDHENGGRLWCLTPRGRARVRSARR